MQLEVIERSEQKSTAKFKNSLKFYNKDNKYSPKIAKFATNIIISNYWIEEVIH